MHLLLPISGTFDLEEVSVIPIDDQHDRNLCVTCTVRRGSEARGCLVLLRLHKGNETVPMNFTVGRSERCTVQEPGLYIVEVFDYHADRNLSELPAYSQDNFRIPHTLRPQRDGNGQLLLLVVLCILTVRYCRYSVVNT